MKHVIVAALKVFGFLALWALVGILLGFLVFSLNHALDATIPLANAIVFGVFFGGIVTVLLVERR